MVLPPFVCVLPCKNPPCNTYRMHGCSKGLHVTVKDTANLQASFYPLMAKTILTGDYFQPVEMARRPGLCVCLKEVVPRATSPVLYLENCTHGFHYGCVPCIWPSMTMRGCPWCQVASYRGVLWPQLFTSPEEKNKVFQLQKDALGLQVSPQTALRVEQYRDENVFFVRISGKTIELGTHGQGSPSVCQMSANCAHCFAIQERFRLVALYKCPAGVECQLGGRCLLGHPGTNLAELPPFFSVANTRFGPSGTSCSVRIQVDDKELPACLNGFHPTVEHLRDVDSFAADMAKQIMDPVKLGPTFRKVCLLCKTPASHPKSIRLHLQYCAHWLHPECLPQARKVCLNKKRPFELHCYVCGSYSGRAIAWPGNFLSPTMKKSWIGLQLNAFKLHVNPDTCLSIAQDPNKASIFTVDYGARKVVVIDTSVN